MSEYMKVKDIDLECFGILWGQFEPYDCTPLDAEILCHAGVDGIHYCRVPEYGKTIFSVSPMEDPIECVVAVAWNLEDFLGLVMACGGEANILRAYSDSEEDFNEFIGNLEFSDEQKEKMTILEEKYGITPMDDPYEYLDDVRIDFDYDDLRFSDEFKESLRDSRVEKVLEKWNVTYEDGFFGEGPSYEEEIDVSEKFSWNGDEWAIPSAYVFDEGIMIPLCHRMEPGEYVSADQEAILWADGIRLEPESASYIRWNIDDECYDDDLAVVMKLGLDPEYGWEIITFCFPWEEKKITFIESMKIRLSWEPEEVTASEFEVSERGYKTEIVHPVTGEVYDFEVKDFEKVDISETLKGRGGRFPSKMIVMEYEMIPEPKGYEIYDVDPDDELEYDDDGILGGGIGAVMIGSAEKKLVSPSLTFTERKSVTWRVTFHVKNVEDIEIGLI